MSGNRKGFKYCSKVWIKMPHKPNDFTLACTHYAMRKLPKREAKAMAKVFGEKAEWKIEYENMYSGEKLELV